VPATLNQVGAMLTLFFSGEPVTNFASARKADTNLFARYWHAMLDQGIYLGPSQFEAAMVSLAHTEADIERARQAAVAFFKQL
jgi:glutamate-1-semialdehyde 2,1-aminomutase